MSYLMPTTPVVMSISSHDPCGGAGISADIETLSSLGCHCTPVITRLCASDTAELKDSLATDSSLLIEQARAVLEDIEVNLFKIGNVASIANAEAIHTIIQDYPGIPVVLDPTIDNDEALTEATRSLLLPLAEIIVLTVDEARRLAPGSDTLAACAQEIIEDDCEHILITGAHGSSATIRNQLFSRKGLSQSFEWERLPNTYLGAGNTLSAALSAYRSHQISLLESVKQAQQFTWQALRQGRRIGMGKLLPDRMHWCRKT